MNPIFSPGTLKALLNSAPAILQGAGKLMQMIRERNARASQFHDSLPTTLEGLKAGLERLDQRQAEGDKSDLEQIRLIQELARQHELLTESFNKSFHRLRVVTVLSLFALATGIAGILLTLLVN